MSDKILRALVVVPYLLYAVFLWCSLAGTVWGLVRKKQVLGKTHGANTLPALSYGALALRSLAPLAAVGYCFFLPQPAEWGPAPGVAGLLATASVSLVWVLFLLTLRAASVWKVSRGTRSGLFAGVAFFAAIYPATHFVLLWIGPVEAQFTPLSLLTLPNLPGFMAADAVWGLWDYTYFYLEEPYVAVSTALSSLLWGILAWSAATLVWRTRR